MYNFNMIVDLTPVLKFFWDYDADSLNWEQNGDLIVRRILQSGDFQSFRWLRAQMGDQNLRDWIQRHNARGLSPRQIRYWALILEIDPAKADAWVHSASSSLWGKGR